eukprot:m.46191 g.46191  ORF g.46191 m.46191 type:complete len:808 (-) comp7255_c1_seq1:456-2879(-)
MVEKRRRQQERTVVLERLAADKKARKNAQPHPSQGLPTSHETLPSPSPSFSNTFIIQVRHSSGKRQVLSLEGDSTIGLVFTELDLDDPSRIQLILNYPKRVFTIKDSQTCIADLGVPPRFVLNVKETAQPSIQASQASHSHMTPPQQQLFQHRLAEHQDLVQNHDTNWDEQSGRVLASGVTEGVESNVTDRGDLREVDGENESEDDGGEEEMNLHRFGHSSNHRYFHGEGHRLDESLPSSSTIDASTLATNRGDVHGNTAMDHFGISPVQHMDTALRASKFSTPWRAHDVMPHSGDMNEIGTGLPGDVSLLRNPVPPLRKMCTDHVSQRLFATDHPILSLATLPSSLALEVMDQTLARGDLNRQTIKAFRSCGITSLKFSSSSTISDELLHYVSQQFPLQELTLQNCDTVTHLGIGYLKDARFLKALVLEGSHFKDSLMKSLSSITHLKVLVLSGLTISSSACANYLKNDAASCLTSLTLKNCENLDDCIVHPISKLSELVYLNLRGTKVSTVGSLASLQKLTYLNLSNTFATTTDVAALHNLSITTLKLSQLMLDASAYEPWRDNTSLTSLFLSSRHSFDDACLRHVITMKNLSSLNLADYYLLTPEALSQVWKMQRLDTLDVSNTHFSDRSLPSIHGNDDSVVTVASLNLSRTAVSNDSAAAFKCMPSLIRLNLSNTNITNKFFGFHPFEECKFLHHLSLDSNRISTSGVKKLQAAHFISISFRQTWVQVEKIRAIFPGVTLVVGREQARDIFPFNASDDEILENLPSMVKFEQSRQRQLDRHQRRQVLDALFGLGDNHDGDGGW